MVRCVCVAVLCCVCVLVCVVVLVCCVSFPFVPFWYACVFRVGVVEFGGVLCSGWLGLALIVCGCG